MKRAAALLVALVLAACSSSTKTDGHRTALSGTITVDAAASLTGAFTAIGKAFEQAKPNTTVRFNFGGSSTLATQINQGAPVDVFASAAPANMKTVLDAGNAKDPKTFVKNTLEIAVAPGNPKHITSVADLTKPGIKVALCEPAVPCGAVAAAVFKNANVTVKPAALEPDVKATLAVVGSGEVDAGLVYVTDVQAAGSAVTGVPIPAGQDVSTDYPIAVLKQSKNSALAEAFVAYVTSPGGLKVLTAAGFRSP